MVAMVTIALAGKTQLMVAMVSSALAGKTQLLAHHATLLVKENIFWTVWGTTHVVLI